MDSLHLIDAAAACISNGERLLHDAECLRDFEHPAGTPFALATIAQEEFAKAFLLFLVSKGVITWNPLIYRVTRNHTCKQLLGFVMSYLSPDIDEYLKWSKEWVIEI